MEISLENLYVDIWTQKVKHTKQVLIRSNFNEKKRDDLMERRDKNDESYMHTCKFQHCFNVDFFFFNWTWIPGCWVHVSSILKTISTCRVPKQSEKTLVVLAPGCQVN